MKDFRGIIKALKKGVSRKESRAQAGTTESNDMAQQQGHCLWAKAQGAKRFAAAGRCWWPTRSLIVLPRNSRRASMPMDSETTAGIVTVGAGERVAALLNATVTERFFVGSQAEVAKSASDEMRRRFAFLKITLRDYRGIVLAHAQVFPSFHVLNHQPLFIGQV